MWKICIYFEKYENIEKYVYIFQSRVTFMTPQRHSGSRLTAQTARESGKHRCSGHRRTTEVKHRCKTYVLLFTHWRVSWSAQKKKKSYRQRKEFDELLDANCPFPLLEPKCALWVRSLPSTGLHENIKHHPNLDCNTLLLNEVTYFPVGSPESWYDTHRFVY